MIMGRQWDLSFIFLKDGENKIGSMKYMYLKSDIFKKVYM